MQWVCWLKCTNTFPWRDYPALVFAGMSLLIPAGVANEPFSLGTDSNGQKPEKQPAMNIDSRKQRNCIFNRCRNINKTASAIDRQAYAVFV